MAGAMKASVVGGRKQWFVGWLLVGVGLVIAAVWGLSWWYTITWRGPVPGSGNTDEFCVTLEQGLCQVEVGAPFIVSVPRFEVERNTTAWRYRWKWGGYSDKARGVVPEVPGAVGIVGGMGGAMYSVTRHVWYFAVDHVALAALFVGGGLLWWGGRVWRRARQGLCRACGYSREGLDAGTVCPECGAGGERNGQRANG